MLLDRMKTLRMLVDRCGSVVYVSDINWLFGDMSKELFTDKGGEMMS